MARVKKYIQQNLIENCHEYREAQTKKNVNGSLLIIKNC